MSAPLRPSTTRGLLSVCTSPLEGPVRMVRTTCAFTGSRIPGSGGGNCKLELQLPPPDPGIRLPVNAHVVLTILTGPSKGEVHTLSKPRVVLGRKGADIPVNDPEISRHHCLLEVRDTYVNLKDMDSTNGTFYDEERVRAAMLQDGTEFRIGVSLIRVNFQPK